MNKNLEIQELFNTITSIYLKNKNYFLKKHPTLLKKIKDFEDLKIENYFLEFINNHFEIVDSYKNEIYNCDPFYDSQKRALKIKDAPCFSLIKNTYITQSVHYDNSINAYENINAYQEANTNKKEYAKFIFIGTLLGVHLNDIDKKLNSKAYLIIEDNLEIFRLSLFLTDYESLEKNSKLFFCINEDFKEDIYNSFLNYNKNYNSYIGFELSQEKYLDYIDILTKFFIDSDPYNYPFSEYIISLKRIKFYQKNSNYGLLKLNTQKRIFENKPVLFLGAGPSLSIYTEWIYMNQDYFIIICAAACLKRLELLDIKPDIILSIDGQKNLVEKQFQIINKKFYSNSLIISSIKTDPSIIENLNLENIFFIQDNVGFLEDHKIFTGVTIGDIGLDLILTLDAKEIYLLGFDAAIKDDGRTHTGSHRTTKIKIKEANIKENEGFDTRKDLIKVKGNFKEEVYTLMLYIQMIKSINDIVLKIDNSVKIYNLSNGAYFNNTIPINANKIDKNEVIDKTLLHKRLKKSLISLSIKDLSKKDLQAQKQEKKIIKKLKHITINNLDKEFNKYQNSYTNSISIQILDSFFSLIKPYTNKETKELEFIQFKEVVEELEKLFN